MLCCSHLCILESQEGETRRVPGHYLGTTIVPETTATALVVVSGAQEEPSS